jgi:hypothetical protein
MEDFRKRNKGSLIKSLLLPGMGVAQAVLFISQFSAVSTLARDKVRCITHLNSRCATFLFVVAMQQDWQLCVTCV